MAPLSNITRLVAVLSLAYWKYCEATTCTDRIDSCREYSKNDCQVYKQWAKDDCAKTCGLCAPASPCPAGWKQYTGDRTCLMVFGIQKASQRTRWSFGRKACQKFGGNLVIIRDEHKNAFVKDMVPKGSTVWIGLRNIASRPADAKFQYVDSSWPGDYHPSINPDHLTDRDRCVTLQRGLWDGYWKYHNCQANAAFVCQKQAVRPVG